MKSKKIISTILITIFVFSVFSTATYAAGYSSTAYYNAYVNKQSASQNLENRKAALEKASDDLKNAEAVEAEKKDLFEKAKAAKESLEQELAESSDLQQANALIEEKRKAVEKATDELDNAGNYPEKYSREAYNNAAQSVNNAAAVLKEKNDLLDKAETALNNAKAVKEQKQAEYDKALKEAEEAVKDVNVRIEAAEKSVQQAQNNYDDAKSVYDNSGKAFLESGAAIYTLESGLEKMRSANGSVGLDENGNKIYWNDYMDTEDFWLIVNDCLKPENIQKSIGFMKEGNQIRASLGKDPQVVSYDAMLGAVICAAYYPWGEKFGRPHVGAAAICAGSLAVGYDDPFLGWYYKEKMYYLAKYDENKVERTEFSKELVSDCLEKVEKESKANGHDFIGCYKKYWRTRDNFIDYAIEQLYAGTAETGHYNGVIGAKTITGFAFSPNSGKVSLWNTNNCAAQSLVTPGIGYVGRDTTTCTVEEFDEQFKNYMAPIEQNLTDSETALENAAAEYNKLIQERDNTLNSIVSEKEEALNAANAAVASAQIDYDAALKVRDSSKKDKDAADEVLADQTENKHYWEAEEAASEALKTANNDLTVAQSNKDAIESAIKEKYPDAAAYDTYEAAYSTAKAAAENAQVSYNKAKAEYDEAVSAKDQADAAFEEQEAHKSEWYVSHSAPVYQSTGVNVSIKKPAAAKKAITVKWKKLSKKNQKKISGYQIQISTDPGFTANVKTVTAKKSASSKKIKKLGKKTTYYVRIRTYKGNAYGSWSKVKAKKTK